MTDGDERAIRAVIFDYAWAIDFKDWPALRACFTDPCDLAYGGGHPALPHPHEGGGDIAFTRRDDFVDYIARTHAPIRSFHMMGASAIAPEEPGVARARTYGRLVLADPEAGGARFESAGVYEDVVVREPDGAWRLHARKYTRLWSDGDPAILRPREG